MLMSIAVGFLGAFRKVCLSLLKMWSMYLRFVSSMLRSLARRSRLKTLHLVRALDLIFSITRSSSCNFFDVSALPLGHVVSGFLHCLPLHRVELVDGLVELEH